MCESVCVCNGCMPVRAVCKPHSPDLKKRCVSECVCVCVCVCVCDRMSA